MDRHTLAPCYEADDRFVGDRVAALAESNQKVPHSLDPNATLAGRARRRSRWRPRPLGIVDDPKLRDDLLRADRAIPDRGIEVVEGLELVGLGDLEYPILTDGAQARPGQPPQLSFDRLAAVGDVLVPLLALEPLPDLFAGVVGSDQVHPVARRTVALLGRHDLDDVAVLEPVVERHEAVVDLGADAAMADVGVDAIREVEGCGAGG